MVILDACAVIGFIYAEPGAEVVREILYTEQCAIHAINLCEVYKDCLDRSNPSDADAIIDDLRDIGLITREDLDEAIWKQVGRLKNTLRSNIAWADCYAIALSQRLQGRVLTADKEFEPVQDKNICPVQFFR